MTVPPDAAMTVNTAGDVEVTGLLTVEVTRDPETNKINGVYHVRAQRIRSV